MKTSGRREIHVKPVEIFLENKRLKWFGHCLRREPNHICAKSLRLEVSGRRNRGRPRRRWRDNILQGDMKKYQLTEDMAQDRKYWMTKILAGPAQGDGQERWESWESLEHPVICLTQLPCALSHRACLNKHLQEHSIPRAASLLLRDCTKCCLCSESLPDSIVGFIVAAYACVDDVGAAPVLWHGKAQIECCQWHTHLF